jgi:UPF0042 nucleotide-binding protein
MTKRLRIVVITGISGSGKSIAIQALEDIGFFCVDNLPPIFIEKFVELSELSSEISKIGLCIDVRGTRFFSEAFETFKELKNQGSKVTIIFLEAQDEVLLRRFSETRRPHPLFERGELSTIIKEERERLFDFRSIADLIIDTSSLTPHQLRKRIQEYCSQGRELETKMAIKILSFGFKYGLPQDADLVFDVRFLPNPYFVRELKELSGIDPKVSEYVFKTKKGEEFLEYMEKFLKFLLPHYRDEGKSYLTIALGCTGGRHRSVALAEKLAEILEKDIELSVYHRDIHREL